MVAARLAYREPTPAFPGHEEHVMRVPKKWGEESLAWVKDEGDWLFILTKGEGSQWARRCLKAKGAELMAERWWLQMRTRDGGREQVRRVLMTSMQVNAVPGEPWWTLKGKP